MSLYPKSPLTDGRLDTAVHQFTKEMHTRLQVGGVVLAFPVVLLLIPIVIDLMFDRRILSNPAEFFPAHLVGWLVIGILNFVMVVFLRQRFGPITTVHVPEINGDYKFFLYRWGRSAKTRTTSGFVMTGMITGLGLLMVGFYLFVVRGSALEPIFERFLIIEGVTVLIVIVSIIVSLVAEWRKAQSWYEEKYG